jgi:formamidopyrimidine-DNA glycosylase
VAEFLAGITKTQFQQWQRRGKYLLGRLEDDQHHPQGWLGVHLRMTGQLLWVDQTEPLQKHTRVRLFFSDYKELRFVDQRTFGKMWWVPPGVEPPAIISGLQSMGVEPLSPEFTPDYLAGRLHKRHRAIKTALLDQATVAGIGNIYADEALFLAGIMPDRICANLNIAQIIKLQGAIVQVLETSLKHGGTTFSDFLNVQGINGNYGGVANVYNRTGSPCTVCQTPIARIKLGGRSSHFCPQCQQS